MDGKKLDRGSVDRKSIVMTGWRKSEGTRTFIGKHDDSDAKMPFLDPETNSVVRDPNKLKLAVTLKTVRNIGDTSTPFPFFGELDTKAPLKDFIEELCTHWGLENPDQYALQYERPEPNAQYITEQNRTKIKDGIVLHLVISAPCMSDSIMERMEATPGEKKSALEDLIRLAPDATLSRELDGSKLMSLLNICREKHGSDLKMLSLTLNAYRKSAIHGILSWEWFEPPFIEKVASYVSQQATADTSVLSASMCLLKHIMLHNQTCFDVVEKHITFPKLQQHFQHTELQASVLGVITSFITKSDVQRHKYWMDTIFSYKGRRFILENIYRGPKVVKLTDDLAHELYILQHILFSHHSHRVNNAAQTHTHTQAQTDTEDSQAQTDSYTQDAIQKLKNFAVYSCSETSSVPPRHQNIKQELVKLGFKDENNPSVDLSGNEKSHHSKEMSERDECNSDVTKTPIAILALSNMLYFAKHKTDLYVRLIRDISHRTDSYICPFARVSIKLTKLLCKVFEIGEEPSESGRSFYPLVLNHEYPLEAFFCVCIMLCHNTWKQMKATNEDFSAVMQVVEEQIIQVLAMGPHSFDNFTTQLTKFPYRIIKQIWRQRRRDHQTQELKLRPVMELRKQLEPEILDLMQEHRLRFLTEGTWFRMLKGMGAKNKWRHVRLSANHKLLHYGDFEDEVRSLLTDDIKEKIAVRKIEKVLMGIECPHVKEKIIKKSLSSLAFSLRLDETTHLNFICNNEIICNYWVDGINALLGHPMTSMAATLELETLSGMDARLRLLDTEGITIPSYQPTIPAPPTNFNFCFGNTSNLQLTPSEGLYSRPVSIM